MSQEYQLRTGNSAFLNEILERVRRHNQRSELIEYDEAVTYLNKLKSSSFNLQQQEIRARKCKNSLVRILKTYKEFAKCLSTGYLSGYSQIIQSGSQPKKRNIRNYSVPKNTCNSSISFPSEFLTNDNFVTMNTKQNSEVTNVASKYSSDLFAQKSDVCTQTLSSDLFGEDSTRDRIIHDNMLVDINKEPTTLSAHSKEIGIFTASRHGQMNTEEKRDLTDFNIEVVFANEIDQASQASKISSIFIPDIKDYQAVRTSEQMKPIDEASEATQKQLMKDRTFNKIGSSYETYVSQTDCTETGVINETPLMFTDQTQNELEVLPVSPQPTWIIIDQKQQEFETQTTITMQQDPSVIFINQHREQTNENQTQVDITTLQKPSAISIEQNQEQTNDNQIHFDPSTSKKSRTMLTDQNQEIMSDNQFKTPYSVLRSSDKNISDKMELDRRDGEDDSTDDSDCDIGENLTIEYINRKLEKYAKEATECYANITKEMLELASKYKEEEKKKVAKRLVKNVSFMSDSSREDGQSFLEEMRAEFERKEREDDNSDEGPDDFTILDWRKLKI